MGQMFSFFFLKNHQQFLLWFWNREFYPVCLRQCLRQLAMVSASAKFSNDIHSKPFIECFSVWQHMRLRIQKYFSSKRLYILKGSTACEQMFAVSCCLHFNRSVYDIERAFQGRTDQDFWRECALEMILPWVCLQNICKSTIRKPITWYAMGKAWTGLWPKEIYRWQISIWEDTPHNMSSGTRK